MFRKFFALLAALLPLLAQADATFWWGAEGTTLDGTNDFSAGDTTATLNGAASISASSPLVGSNSVLNTDGNDFYIFDPTSIASTSEGSFAFIFRYTTSVAGSIQGVYLEDTADNDEIYITGQSSQELGLGIRKTGAAAIELNTTTANLAADTTYCAVARYDIANDDRRIEVYDSSGVLIQAVEDLTTDLAAFQPGNFNRVSVGNPSSSTVVRRVDSVRISQDYDEEFQHYCYEASYRPAFSASAPGTKTNTTIPFTFTSDQKATVKGVACANGQTSSVAQCLAGTCSGGAAISTFTEDVEDGVGDSATFSGLSAGTTYDVYLCQQNLVGGTSSSATSHADQTTTSGGTPPSFSVSPTVTATSSNSITLSYTPSASSTFYGLSCPPAEGNPSAAQVVAGNCASGAAGVSVSEAVTGADSTSITPILLPVSDAHGALSNAGGESSVVSIASQSRAARSGFAIVVLASCSATGICDQDAYFNPDMAVGDIIEHETATNESANCFVNVSTAGDVTFYDHTDGSSNGGLDSDGGDDSVADCDGRLTFEASYEDVSATSGLFIAPADGDFSTDDKIIANNTAPTIDVADVEIIVLTEDQAMEDRFLLDVCNDTDAGDVLTISVTGGALPNNTSLNSNTGLWGGTPDTEDEGGETVTLRCTDEAGDYAEDDITIFTINTVALIDLVGMDLGEAADAMCTAYPWRCTDPGLSIAAFTCAPGTPTGEITAQDPLAAAAIGAFDVVELTLARSCGGRKLGLDLRLGL